METMTKFRWLGRAVLASSAVLALGAASAGAQTVAYTTAGYFSGSATSATGVTCTTTAGPTAACSYDVFTLAFTNTTHTNIGSGSGINLGNFLLTSTGPGSVTAPPGQLFFHLVINQTSPTTGNTSFVGDISGTVTASTTAGNTSSLVWTPTTNTASIPPSIYTLVFDNIGPAANTGYLIPINDNKALTALVVTTPEPSSMALLGTGLVGLVPMIRRRKK